MLFQCIPTHPSPVGSGPGPASPRHQGHGPSLGSITEVSFDTQQVKFTLMKPPSPAPEAEDTKSDNPADLKLCNTVLKDTSEASNLDQSDQNGCEVKVGDLEHNTVQVEAGPSPTKRPLRVSKSLPIQATSLVPRVCHVTTDTDSPMTSEANVVYTVETANGNASDQNEPGPVAPPRRRSKLAYKTSKKKEQDEEAEGAKNNRPFHSDSDLVTTFSEEDLAVLRALAADSVMADSSKDELDSAPVCKPKTGFMRRMSDKMKIIVRKSGHDDHENGERSEHRRRCRLEEKFEIQDLTSDDDVHLPVTRKVTYFAHAMAGMWECGTYTDIACDVRFSIEGTRCYFCLALCTRLTHTNQPPVVSPRTFTHMLNPQHPHTPHNLLSLLTSACQHCMGGSSLRMFRGFSAPL